MKIIVNLVFFILINLLFTKYLDAKVIINYSKNIVAPELICPAISGLKIKKPSNPIDPFEVPDDTDIQELVNLENSRKYIDNNSITYKKKSGIPSIGLWGDSHVAAYYFTDEIVRLLGLDSKQVFQKFIPPSMGRSGVRLPIRKFCKSAGWSYGTAYRESTNTSSIGLIELESSVPQSFLWVDFRKNGDGAILSGLTIPITTNTNATRLGISIDDQEEQQIEISGSLSPNYIKIESEYAFSTLKIRLISGQLTISGFLPTYNQSPVLYFDTFGIPGATMNGWSKIRATDSFDIKNSNYYDLIILEYGTNEGNDDNFDPNVYRKNLTKNLEVIKNLYPDANCVLIGPTDRGVLVKRSIKKSKGKISKHDLLKFSRRHSLISTIQEDEAQKVGCNFWGWQESMGGPGSSYKWLKQSPQLMSKDLTHLTVQGYQVSAQEFIKKFNLKKLLD
jgi:lysophospholipase L1-like esterase